MKRLLSLLLAVCLAAALIPAAAEETGLLDTLFTGIEDFDPESETLLESPVDPVNLKDQIQFKADMDVFGIQNYGITYDTLGENEKNTYLPTAGMILGACDFLGESYESRNYKAYAGINTYWQQWLVVMVDYSADMVHQLWWTPGLSIGEYYRYGEDNEVWSVNEFMNNEQSDIIYELDLLDNNTITRYVNILRGGSDNYDPLKVGKASYSISSDKQSIFIDKPSISGGSGNVTIAYNIYDNDSNPVNYFYSYENRVAATPGYGGIFNVFIVVTDTITGENNTQNIGWHELNWPYASKLTVGKLSYTLSPDGQSIFLTRPSIACKSGKVTIAYNIYDSSSNPVNYFYSTFPQVAATPGYAGKFNVYVVVKDTGTGETNTQNIGWVNIGTASGACRALLIAMTQVPNCDASGAYHYDNLHIASALPKVNGGAYQVTSKEQLTQPQVLSAIRTAYSGAKAGDVSLFYMGTHGVDQNLTGTSYVDQEGALGCADGSNLKLKILASTLSEANPNNDVLVIISACGSGAAVKGVQKESLFARQVISAFAAVDPGITVEEDVYDENGVFVKRRELCKNKFYVLTAADVYESSWYYSNPSTSGSFTGMALCDALAYSGSYMKADPNHDKKITFDELYKYMYDYCYNLSSRYCETIQHMQRYPTSSSWVAFTY